MVGWISRRGFLECYVIFHPLVCFKYMILLAGMLVFKYQLIDNNYQHMGSLDVAMKTQKHSEFNVSTCFNIVSTN
jgi:hypothetical protein